VLPLEGPYGLLGPGAENAVGGNPERALEGAHAAPGGAPRGGPVGRSTPARRPLPLQHRAGSEAERLTCDRPDDPVRHQAVPALEALHRALGLRPKYAVGGDPERSL
jgi:hypothetical protein